MPTLQDVTRFLEEFAPVAQAAEWDNVGLLLGETNAAIERILLCLTVTPEVVDEAVSAKAQLIVSHHPVLFRATKKLTSQSAEGRLLLPLLRNGIAVYSPHTAFDNCPGGINDGLCERLGITRDIRPLRPRDSSKRESKLVVFVPDSDLGKVSDALFASGAGQIGKYEQCSFRLAGTGTFFGGAGSNPTVGQAGRREEAPEWRLEVVLPEGRVDTAVRAMRAAHSYEEPAFDVYPLRPQRGFGEGRIGKLREPRTLAEMARIAKESLDAKITTFSGNPGKLVETVAVACGAAGEFVSDAIRASADLFITGEARFHDVLAAEAAGLGLILPGHYATERPGVEDLAKRLGKTFPGLEIWASRNEREPLQTA